MLAIIHAIILGIVEGITEFLPISSTGHLIVAEKLLGFHDVHDLFTVVVQLGAILAVMWYFRRDLIAKITGLFRREAEALHFWKLLVLGTIPAGVIGLALDKSMNSITTPTVVAVSLIIGGIILWLVDKRPVPAYRRRKDHEGEADFSRISVRTILLIGLGQAVAIIPGVSRSGATIVSGLALGLNRPTATALSFYLSLPVMILASGLKTVKYADKLHELPGGTPALLVGVLFAFMTALLAVSWLLHYIAHHNFRPFAYYRVAAGVVILLLVASHLV